MWTRIQRSILPAHFALTSSSHGGLEWRVKGDFGGSDAIFWTPPRGVQSRFLYPSMANSCWTSRAPLPISRSKRVDIHTLSPLTRLRNNNNTPATADPLVVGGSAASCVQTFQRGMAGEAGSLPEPCQSDATNIIF